MPNSEQLSYQTDKSSHTGGVLKKNQLFLKILQHSQENTCIACNSIKSRLQDRCFPVEKSLRNTYFEEHLRTAGLLLDWLYEWFFGTFFLDSRFQNHSGSVILQKYQSLSNHSFKYN